MDKFLDTYSLPKLSQEETQFEETDHYTWNKICNKKLPANKSPGLEGFTGEFCQTYKEELIPILLKLFQKTEEEGTFPKSFSEATITLMPKPDKDTTKKKKKSQANIFEYRCKNPQQNISKLNPTTHKRIAHYDQVGFIPWSQGCFNIWKSINVLNHINKRKDKTTTWSLQKSIW